MGLLDLLFSREPREDRGTSDRRKSLPPLRPIGHDDGRCPYCATPLVKLPRQKRPCPHCGKVMFPRKRPVDGKVVLFREEELEELNEQRAIAYGTYEIYLDGKARQEDARARLRKKFGGEPSKSDVNWSLLIDDLVQHANRKQWGLYRNTKLAMAQQLTEEGKTRAALDAWMEVAYLDMNGANNAASEMTETELEQMDRDFVAMGGEKLPRPFDLRYADLLPHTVGQVQDCCQTLGASIDEAKLIFESACKRAPAKSLHPLSPAQAWLQLREALEG